MSLITLNQIKTELDLTGSSYDDLIEFLLSAVESVWNQMTNRTWESATRTDIFSHNGSNKIFLDTPYVTSLEYISQGTTDAMYIQNTTSKAVASVSVDSTDLTYVLNGSSGTLALGTYTTITTLAAAVNDLGSNWAATVYSGEGGWASSNLLPVYGKACAEYALDLSVPDKYLYDFELDPGTGVITGNGFASGNRNIRVKYTAGYSSDTCPAWLKQTLIRQVSHWYMQATEKRWHVSNVSLGDGGTISYNQEGKNQEINLLPDFKNMSTIHRKHNI